MRDRHAHSLLITSITENEGKSTIAANLALALAGSTPLPGRLWARLSGRGFAWVLLFGLFWLCVYFIATAAGDPFLYFSF